MAFTILFTSISMQLAAAAPAGPRAPGRGQGLVVTVDGDMLVTAQPGGLADRGRRGITADRSLLKGHVNELHDDFSQANPVGRFSAPFADRVREETG